MQEHFFDWIRALAPVQLNAQPKEWLRATLAVGIVMALSVSLGVWLFGVPVTLSLAGPAGDRQDVTASYCERLFPRIVLRSGIGA